MTQLLLIRHAENDWMHSGKLAGRMPGVHLNAEGQRQAEALGRRLADASLRAVYSSPLERATETAQALLKHHPALTLQIEPGMNEVDYGEWQGKSLRKLARTRLWKVVQSYPSGAQFPRGEDLRAMQVRAVDAVERIAQKHPDTLVAVVSHADVIKAVVAHYAGMHLDQFQRIIIAPASISIIALGRMGPHIVRINDISHYEVVRKGNR